MVQKIGPRSNSLLAVDNSLLPQKNSLLGIQNSLLRCVGNLAVSLWIHSLNGDENWRMSPKSSKIPCKFPASREFETETGPIRTVSSADQSGLELTFLRHPGISAVARYFGGGEPVSTDGFGGFNGLRGRCLQGLILTNGFR